MRGLIIKQPWADMIVNGEKTWELRKTCTKHRGELFILSGGKIIGKGNLTDVYGPFSAQGLSRYFKKHKANNGDLLKYSKGKKLFIWDIFGAKIKPIHYEHPKGAVVWVKLTDDSFNPI